MNSTVGERKCALLLTTLAPRDRRRMLAALPASSAARIRGVLSQLLAMPVPIAELAQTLLADEVTGLTSETTLELDRLIELSEHLPAPWFARVLAAWTGVDRSFCLSLLERGRSAAVSRELQELPPLPPRLAAALKAEAVALAARRRAA
ncbi:MAG TPA: hypothetical protein VGD42_01920 [Lysobacter sp.]